MSQPSQLSLEEQMFSRSYSSFLEELSVWYFLPLSDAKDALQAADVKCLEGLDVTESHRVVVLRLFGEISHPAKFNNIISVPELVIIGRGVQHYGGFGGLIVAYNAVARLCYHDFVCIQ